MSHQETATLLTNAVNVMNTALAEHREEMPWKQLVAATDELFGDRKVGVAIYAEDPGAPFDFYTLRWKAGHGFELASRGKEGPDVTWKVSRGYLQKVADHPDEYTQHPAKLDWDWLRDRLGLA
jgi:hypothetical protein